MQDGRGSQTLKEGGSAMPKSSTSLQRHLVSINQAADHVGVSARTIRRAISRGEIQAVRLGPRLIRIDVVQLDAALRPIPTAGGNNA